MENPAQDKDDAKVFISYSRRDRDKAQRFSEFLRERHFGVFRDTEDILPTEEWKTRLEQLIAEADTIVFLLSPSSAVSEVCAWEIEYATELGKRIAPIVIEEVDTALIPPKLARLNFIFATDRDPFENALDTLISALKVDIDWIREHTRLGGLALRWSANGEPGNLLLRGQDIADAENWRDTHPTDAPAVTVRQSDFITQSRRAASRRQSMIVVGSLVGLVVAIALSAFAWRQSVEADKQRVAAEAQLRTAQINESQFLARRSHELAGLGDYTAAAQVALMALPQNGGTRPVTPAGESALRHALGAMSEVAYLPPLSDAQRVTAEISENGNYAAQSDGADRVVVTDLRTMETLIDQTAPSWWTNFIFTPDGRFLQIIRRKSINTRDGSVTDLWDLETGEQISSFDGRYEALSPDGRSAVVKLGESYAHQILVLDAASNEPQRTLAKDVQAIGDFSFDGTGDWLLMKGRVRIEDTLGWYVANLTTGAIRQLSLQSGEARWSGNGNTLLTKKKVDQKNIIEFWAAPYETPVATLSADFANSVHNMTLSPDARFIDFIADDQQVMLEVKTGEVLRRMSEQREIAVLPGSEVFAMKGGTSIGIEFHSLSAPGLLNRNSRLGSSPKGFSTTGDGSRLVTLGWDGSIHVWDIPEFIQRPLSLANRLENGVQRLEFTSNSSALVAFNHNYQNLVIADVSKPPGDGRGAYLGGSRGLPSRFLLDRPSRDHCGKERYLDQLLKVRRIKRPANDLDAGSTCPVAMALSPDGNVIVRLHARNAKSGVELQSPTGAFETVFLPKNTFALNWIRFSADGRLAMITTGQGSGNGGVVVIDLERRALVELDGIDQTRGTGSTVITSDNKRLIAPTEQGFKIWSIETGQVLGTIPQKGLKLDPVMGFRTEAAYLFSDDRRLLLTTNSTGWIVDIETGEILVEDIAPFKMARYHVSPDETLIATSSYGEQFVRVWDLEKGAFVAKLSGFVTSQASAENGISAVAFSPDGNLIAAGSLNGRIRVWSYPRDLSRLITHTRETLPRWMDAEDLNLFGE